MDEEIDVGDEGGDDENPLVAPEHITEAVDASPGDAYHCKENAGEAVGGLIEY